MSLRRCWRTPVLSPELQAIAEAITVPYMYNMKHKKEFGYVKTVRVVCEKRRHAIILRQRGPITLVNHPNVAYEKNLIRLGNDKPKCLVVFDMLRKHYANKHCDGMGRRFDFIFELNRRWHDRRGAHRDSFVDILTDIDYPNRVRQRVRVWMDDFDERARAVLKSANTERGYYSRKMPYLEKIYVSIRGKFDPGGKASE